MKKKQIEKNNEEENILKEINEYLIEGAKIYEIIGKFIFEFQEVCSAIKTCLYKGFSHKGLHDIKLAQNVVEHNSAYQLATSLKSFYADFNKKDTKGLLKINKILNRFIKISEIRNDILHGDINVTFIDNNNKKISFLSGTHLRHTKSGISNSLKENHLDGKKYNIGHYNEAYFKEIVLELKQIRNYLNYFSLYIEKGYDIGSDLKQSKYIRWDQFNRERDYYLNKLK